MDDVQLSRRRLLGAATAAGALAATGGALLGGRSQRALAQDEQAGAAATPTALGPAIPEEYTVETNWAGENYDLSATRDAKGTNISSETVGHPR